MIHFRDAVTEEEIWLCNDTVCAVSVAPYRLSQVECDADKTSPLSGWRVTIHLTQPLHLYAKGEVSELREHFNEASKAFDRAEAMSRELKSTED